MSVKRDAKELHLPITIKPFSMVTENKISQFKLNSRSTTYVKAKKKFKFHHIPFDYTLITNDPLMFFKNKGKKNELVFNPKIYAKSKIDHILKCESKIIQKIDEKRSISSFENLQVKYGFKHKINPIMKFVNTSIMKSKFKSKRRNNLIIKSGTKKNSLERTRYFSKSENDNYQTNQTISSKALTLFNKLQLAHSKIRQLNPNNSFIQYYNLGMTIYLMRMKDYLKQLQISKEK